MQTWMYGLLAIPVVAVGAAYSMGAFSTKTSELDQRINAIQEERRQFTGDDGTPYGGRRKKTKKSKSGNKKTKRRG
jgi:hypothetical protein